MRSNQQVEDDPRRLSGKKKAAIISTITDTTSPSPTILRQAMDQPDGQPLNPETILQLQRTYGNQYVQRLVNSRRGAATPSAHLTPAVQRYFLHTPGGGEATPQQFPAQQKRAGTTTFLNGGNTGPYIRHPRAGGVLTVPQLRVSDDGNLAIEDTNLANRQSKVFFATPGIVRESNARLTEIDAPYRLHVDNANAVTINAPLHAPPVNHPLDRIVPTDVAGRGGTGIKMSLPSDKCNEVAEQVTKSGSLGGIAKIQGADRELPNNDPETRFARYIADRQAGDNHLTAVGKLNNPMPNRAAIAQTYAEISEPAIKTGEEMETALGGLGVNYWGPMDAALGNYLGARNGGQAHGLAAGAQLGGLNLNPGQIAIVEQSYNSLKVTQIATAIHAAMAGINPLPLPNGFPTQTPSVDQLKRYVAQRLENGLTHSQACLVSSTIGAINETNQAAYSGAVDIAYGTALGVVAGFNGTDIRNQLKTKSPDLTLARKIEAYVKARHGGQTHLAAVGLLAGANLAANVLNNIDQAYNQVVAAYPQTPAQQATDLAQALRDLGVNQFSAPEIGQIFGSGMTGDPGPDGKTFDYKSGRYLNASSQGWSSHYGTIVALSGSDRITLENYARDAENQGQQEGRLKQYYFQMYGTGAGQSWHESWTNADRPVMNGVTAVYGDSKPSVWKNQLDNIPGPEAGVVIPNYATQLAAEKLNIDGAGTVANAKIAYLAALDTLVTMSVTAHRARANAIGAKPALAPPNLAAVNTLADAAQVILDLNAWVVSYQQELAGKWTINLVGKSKLNKKIRRLQAIIAKINALVAYHEARNA